MQQPENRYTGVMVIAQHGPENGKPAFGFIPAIKTTYPEHEAGFHYQVVREVMIEQGCAEESMVFCDIDDLPEYI